MRDLSLQRPASFDERPAFFDQMRQYLIFSRPFTLIAPMLGVASGALTAWGSRHSAFSMVFSWDLVILVAVASLAAGLLNAASNGLNQIYDLEIDRINKPDRPLVTEAISLRGAHICTWFLYVLSVGMTWPIVADPNLTWAERWTAPLAQHECFFFYLTAAVFTWIYSMPAFGRTKRLTFGANLTIAIPRGLMLKVAGWSVLAGISAVEPWFIGLCFFFFLIGAASTKDFSDMKGDGHGKCLTLPRRFGVRRAATYIAPCFVLPWLLIPLGVFLNIDGQPILSGDPVLLVLLGLSLATWGGYTVYLILRDPEALSRMENHPSWKHMYLMMFWAQMGFALAYLVRL
ncbi:UbiA family prenyltransferase [Acanthopleuribacter pedis]|uniref:UbiA family prenyltransferase n=1 Tax=Acanthopleuribacter pedis TaxID=442870 RepID=A0A8J7QL13_9BACT|nr:UbiA family prenyltransferase [Acanthopleuribacter pedis]MBO1320198.1 UbiA family prenyltransferase [Acanthopleuribacter pedis]